MTARPPHAILLAGLAQPGRGCRGPERRKDPPASRWSTAASTAADCDRGRGRCRTWTGSRRRGRCVAGEAEERPPGPRSRATSREPRRDPGRGAAVGIDAVDHASATPAELAGADPARRRRARSPGSEPRPGPVGGSAAAPGGPRAAGAPGARSGQGQGGAQGERESQGRGAGRGARGRRGILSSRRRDRRDVDRTGGGAPGPGPGTVAGVPCGWGWGWGCGWGGCRGGPVSWAACRRCPPGAARPESAGATGATGAGSLDHGHHGDGGGAGTAGTSTSPVSRRSPGARTSQR